MFCVFWGMHKSRMPIVHKKRKHLIPGQDCLGIKFDNVNTTGRRLSRCMEKNNITENTQVIVHIALPMIAHSIYEVFGRGRCSGMRNLREDEVVELHRESGVIISF